MSRSRSAGFALVFAAGIALRLVGIGWGLPGHMAPDEPPIHPDEHVAFEEGMRLYDSPNKMAFVWGGALYPRTAALLRIPFAGVEKSTAARSWPFD